MEILLYLKEEVKPGKSTFEFEEIALRLCEKKGVKPAFKGYRGYPYALCISINEEIVHGMPRKDRVLKEGDIVSFDFGVIYEGYVGDAALTVGVGEISEEAKKLLKVTEEALYKGIEKAHFGNRIGDISFAIQSHVEKHGFNVIREFVGHGGGSVQSTLRISSKPIASDLVPYGAADMVLAIEPMESLRYLSFLKEEGWLVTNSVPFLNIANYPELDSIIVEIKKIEKHVIIDADAIAAEVATKRASNMVMLGAGSLFIDLEVEAIQEGIRQIFAAKGDRIIDMNIAAMMAGREAAGTFVK